VSVPGAAKRPLTLVMFVILKTYKFKTMKIELIRTEEPDGTWYKILVDGSVQKCFGMRFISEEKARESAEAAFEKYVEGKGVLLEVIKSVTI
jgi:hypothetical protein